MAASDRCLIDPPTAVLKGLSSLVNSLNATEDLILGGVGCHMPNVPCKVREEFSRKGLSQAGFLDPDKAARV